ncbi:hypothetical protein ONZ45_g9557 [Pleurotus djamor]|nr:hypothetical protein ONZ45_g9557 [Pleurotus djamor]
MAAKPTPLQTTASSVTAAAVAPFKKAQVVASPRYPSTYRTTGSSGIKRVASEPIPRPSTPTFMFASKHAFTRPRSARGTCDPEPHLFEEAMRLRRSQTTYMSRAASAPQSPSRARASGQGTCHAPSPLSSRSSTPKASASTSSPSRAAARRPERPRPIPAYEPTNVTYQETKKSLTRSLNSVHGSVRRSAFDGTTQEAVIQDPRVARWII